MRRVVRTELTLDIQLKLKNKQTSVNKIIASGKVESTRIWDAAKKSAAIIAARNALKKMAIRERCMYCHDSLGSDIEHFWPKDPYPERMFVWENMLLCCTPCGRFKGNRFPLDENNAPLLVDPVLDEPWDYISFEPLTGNIVPRYDPVANSYSQKGTETVTLLKLDRRESLSLGYKKTYRLINHILGVYLYSENGRDVDIVKAIIDLDEYGLIGWCILGSGIDEPHFKKLRETQNETWQSLVQYY